MIKAIGISYSYGENFVFNNSSFTVARNSKVGLVGPNGAGKTTLFKLLSGKEFVDKGKLIIEGHIEEVSQEIKEDILLEKSTTIREYTNPSRLKDDYELKTMLAGLELGKLDLNQSPLLLSGGQKTRLAICRALIAEPDILLLDEPTNFLDISGKRWVMNFLSKYPKTLILVSHDLKLMDKYIDKVLAINIQFRTIDEYTGNYSNYLKQKHEIERIVLRKRESERKHIKHMEEGILKMQRFTSKKGVRQRTLLKKRVRILKEKLPPAPQELKVFKIKFPEPPWIGEIPIKATDICKKFGSKIVLDNVNLSLYRGEKLVLVGPNGAGKSTFIKILLGLVPADDGEIILDEKLLIGHYLQESESLDPQKTLLDTLMKTCNLGETKVRSFLGRFMFAGNKVFQKIDTLSGGEKTRLSIAILLLQNFNFLILDEPTTYLDPLSQRIILESLKEYKGTMLIVSHTEEFILELKPQRALFLPEHETKIWSDELLSNVGEV